MLAPGHEFAGPSAQGRTESDKLPVSSEGPADSQSGTQGRRGGEPGLRQRWRPSQGAWVPQQGALRDLATWTLHVGPTGEAAALVGLGEAWSPHTRLGMSRHRCGRAAVGVLAVRAPGGGAGAGRWGAGTPGAVFTPRVRAWGVGKAVAAWARLVRALRVSLTAKPVLLRPGAVQGPLWI